MWEKSLHLTLDQPSFSLKQISKQLNVSLTGCGGLAIDLRAEKSYLDTLREISNNWFYISSVEITYSPN